MSEKTETIMLRVDPETKKRLTDAATAKGESLTAFVLDAANKAARKPSKKAQTPDTPSKDGPFPTWFKAMCYTASQGGASNYANAGSRLFCALASEIPWQYDDDEWAGRINMLYGYLTEKKDSDALAWFDKELPRCMAIVPAKRRTQFLKGVYEAFER